MSNMDRWIHRYESKVRWGEFLRRAAETFALYLFIFGGAVLIVRLSVPQAWPHILWLGLGVIPATLVAAWMARRNRQSRTETVAQLDRAVGAGGLLMTLAELPDEEWNRHLPYAEAIWNDALPRLRPKRFASYLALPLFFAAAACFVPLREAISTPVLKNTVAQQATEELEELLGSLEEAAVLDKEEKEQMKEEIAKLVAETEQTPLTHEKWESVDALREKMQSRLDTASGTMQKFEEALSMLAKAGTGDADELSIDETMALEKDVQEALEQLIKKGAFSKASDGLKSDLERLIKNGQLQLPEGQEAREALLDKLREHLDKEQSKLSKLRKKCENCGEGGCEGECDGMSEAEMEMLAALRKAGARPGRGGVTRGRGDAELTYGDESDPNGTRFKEVILPPGFLEQPKDETVGIERTAPNETAAETAPRDAQRDQDPTAGRTTWNRKLSPRHRNVVRNYFDEQAPSAPPAAVP